MDTVGNLETRWPPDRKSTIEASEFGIYKEPSDGKRRRLRGTDPATGCLLVLSLMAAAAVVVYFTFFDYTIQTTQTAATPVGPVVSYAKYVKDKHWTSVAVADAVDRAAVDRPLAAVPGSERPESTTDEASDGTVDDGDRGRRTRLYRPLNKHLSYDSDYWRTVGAGAEKRADVPGRRSDFPQLAAYRAPFTPKSVVNVMKYVTGSPPHHRAPAGGQGEFMAAQESRYVAIRPAEEVNRFLPDADAPPAGGSKRFRNKFGPPVFLTPPMVAFPDDFMKPPSPGAQFSTDFETAAADVVFHEGSATVPLHTDVVFRHQQPTTSTGYAVPDAPVAEAAVPNKPKNGKAKNKKPISMVVDIYPLADREHEDVEQVEEYEEDHSSEMFTSLKNNIQLSDAEKLLLRLNLFPNFSQEGRRMSIGKKHEKLEDKKPIIHLTTNKPLEIT
ncbi:uncharacterized protein LOC112693587 [Sipha flava]|uniref:Uncharacterized protein LOC112693587 n=2 Tax=Sipha flava TaxID=143950 RepID=A0A8B8GPH2_9HEMI|nr:uncharacterized protein LOC112693587 [Sipha flava]